MRINLYGQTRGVYILKAMTSSIPSPLSSSSLGAKEAVTGLRENKFSKRSCGFTELDTPDAKSNVIFGIRTICYRRIINVSILLLLITHHFLPFNYREERARTAFRGIPGATKEAATKHWAIPWYFSSLKPPACASISRHSRCFSELQLGIAGEPSDGARGRHLCGPGKLCFLGNVWHQTEFI